MAADTERKPITWWVEEQVAQGRWQEQVLPAAVVGLRRDLTVFRAPRRTNLIITRWFGDAATFCPPVWSDLAIGSGPCGLQCRGCFLLLTHRIRRDPRRHLLYSNEADFITAAQQWLLAPERRPQHTLGLGIDRSDSLLYEGVCGYVQRLAPLFGSPASNPQGCRLILLTKSANTPSLAAVAPAHRASIVVSFSVNPPAVAALWEGQEADGTPVPPAIAARLAAARQAQDWGYEVRLRVDPILLPPGWADLYAAFFAQVAASGVEPTCWTLGMFREKNEQLDAWREKWGLPPLGWQPDGPLVAEGTHLRLAAEQQRVAAYQQIIAALRACFPAAHIGLCKETHRLRRTLGLTAAPCNCLAQV